jgi:hypothetical protein
MPQPLTLVDAMIPIASLIVLVALAYVTGPLLTIAITATGLLMPNGAPSQARGTETGGPLAGDG